MKIQEQIELPEPTTPGGSYKSVNIRGKIAYVAVQFPIRNGEYQFLGTLGITLSQEHGYEAMKLCALNVISQIEKHVGIENLEGLNEIDAYYVAHPDWDEAPKVVNGASDTFLEVLGAKGEHARSIFGVQKLPRNFCVGLKASFTLK